MRWQRRRQKEAADEILAAAREDDADEAEAARQRVLDLARQTATDPAHLGTTTPPASG